MDQLACLRDCLKANKVPYANFAIFGPHASRTVTKLKLRGHRFIGNGEFGPIEIFGPPDISFWNASWKVYQNALLMLDAVDLGPLDRYQDRINKYYEEYGQGVWLLLYQTDMRARNERMQRLHLHLQRTSSSLGPGAV